MELWTAFIVGLAGSLHCVGMCGPIVAALPLDNRGRWSFALSRVVYNLGRVVTYALLGILFGLVGRSIFIAGYQQALSITLGVLILLAVLLPGKTIQQVITLAGLNLLYAKISRIWGQLFRNGSRRSLFTIGLLNGLLPCGFVYLGIAGAISTGDILRGGAYMALFGLGTVPILLTLALMGNIVGLRVKRALVRALPALAILLALVFILRGLSLGIPYLSPEISYNPSTGTTESCCQLKDDTQ